MGIYAIFLGSYVWSVHDTAQDATITKELMKVNNRWWRENGGRVDIGRLDKTMPTTDPYTRLWLATWVPGHSGWDLAPYVTYAGDPPETERVIENRPNLQHVMVRAPTAELAQERAVFMLMEGGRT